MTVIEIKPHPWGWKVFEAPGVEPVFREKDHAIGYAETRACFRLGEIRALDLTGNIDVPLRLMRRIECCGASVERQPVLIGCFGLCTRFSSHAHRGRVVP
jgi:hypothetical protein